jgi:transposase InsO family protein
MNREVHVRFWESAGLQCPAPLDYWRDYRLIPEARAGIGRWFQFYNYERPHQRIPNTGGGLREALTEAPQWMMEWKNWYGKSWYGERVAP